MKAYIINEEQLKRIIADTANRLFNQHSPNKPYLTGTDILNFCPHDQVNKFILFQIYQEWSMFTSKLQHPYFDFSDPEVRQGLQAFQAILSQHIRVETKDFKALVNKATYNSVRLILNPIETFNNFFFVNKTNINLQFFEKYVTFFSDFDFIVQSVLSYCLKNEIQQLDQTVFVEKAARLATMYEKQVGQSMEHYRTILFHKLTGQELLQLEQKEWADEPPKPQVKPEPTSDPLAELKQNLMELEALKQKAPAPQAGYATSQPSVSPANYAPQPPVYTPQQPVEPPPVQAQPRPARPVEAHTPAEMPQEPTAEKPSRLADQFSTPQNLNAAFSKQSADIAMDKIPMHKQFQFVQKVFAGNRNKFKDTIDTINGCGSYDEAEQYLRTHILNMPEVNREDLATKEFMQMVRNRFS